MPKGDSKILIKKNFFFGKIFNARRLISSGSRIKKKKFIRNNLVSFMDNNDNKYYIFLQSILLAVVELVNFCLRSNHIASISPVKIFF